MTQMLATQPKIKDGGKKKKKKHAKEEKNKTTTELEQSES